MADVRVLVVADDLLARTGMAALLAGQEGLTVAGQVAGDASLADYLGIYEPDCIVWDLGWEPRAGMERLSALADEAPPILALLPDKVHAADVAAVLTSVETGGMLLRGCDADQLGAALAALARGLLVIAPALAGAALMSPGAVPHAPAETLTPRELEVLQLLAEGLSNKAIALHLKISDHTVKFHVNAIMNKLDAQSRTEAVVRATRLGLIIL